MNFNKKTYFIISLILAVLLGMVSIISYNYGKKVVVNDLIKSGDIYINKREYIKATALYKEIVKHDKDYTDKSMLNLAVTMENSRRAYHDGIIYYNKREYLQALKLFRQVMENDTILFNKAQEKIDECRYKYIEDNFNNAKKSIQNSKYKEANKYLNNILQLDKNNQEAKKLQGELNEKYFN